MCHVGVTVLLLLTLGISSECVLVERTENVTEYLNRRMRETKVEIAKAYMKGNTEPVVTLSYDIKWEKLWSESFNSEGALTVRMFKKMFVLKGNRVMSVALEPASNKTSSSLRQVALIRQERSVTFVKSIVWKSNLYLLVCQDDAVACSLYTGESELRLRHRQIIKHNGRPMDAIFFTRANRLYLVVAHSFDPFPVSSIIYRWTGTYMDIIEEITTVGAVAVTTFEYKKRIIIVFGQNEKAQPDVGSQIYEFNDSGIEMIQYLPTNGPTSVHSYHHKGEIFLLTINEHAVSNVYWWDGREFLHWLDLADIVAPRMVNIVHLNDDTLFFVSHENRVCLYKVTNTEYSRLNLLELKNGETVVDMGVWIDEKATLTLLLITVDTTHDLYRIEPWELRINKIFENAGINEAAGTTEECLSKLHARLNDRMEPVENVARHTWPKLLSSAKNISAVALSGTSRLGRLILRSADIAKLDVSTKEEILLASEIEALAESTDSAGIRTMVNSILDESRKTVRTDEDNSLTGDIVVRKNGVFEQLHTNIIRTEYLNGESAELENSAISATKNQTFSHSQPLQGKNITVHQLEIDQLCGMSHDYWLTDEKMNYIKDNPFKIINDSIVIRSDELFLRNLALESVESVHMNDFLSNLFVRGERQRIKGDVIQRSSGTLNSNDLIIEELNGVSESDFMTRERKQRFENSVFVKRMSIENLLVEKVNGIAVAESAMVSKKNNIKGQVTVANIRISDELVIDNATKFPKVNPVQVYDEVRLVGRIRATNLALEAHTYFAISAINDSTIGEETSIASTVQSHWTKSTSQIVNNRVTLDAGLSVDQLRLKYLNGLDIDEDVVLTNAKEIFPVAGSLEFKNVIFSGSIFEDRTDEGFYSKLSVGSNELYAISDDTLCFNEEFRIERLGVEQLLIKSFNGIPLDVIINWNKRESGPYEYSDEVQRFDSVTVNDRLEAEHLEARFVNGPYELLLDSLLEFDADYKIEYLTSEVLTLGGDVRFVAATANYIKEFSNSLASNSTTDNILLTIDGELLIEGNLQVNAINDEGTRSYLNNLATQDLVVNSYDGLIIDDLTVRHDFELNFLPGSRIESLRERTFSKSRPQDLSESNLSFFKVSVDHLETDRINDLYTRNLIYTDLYDVNFGGDVMFTNLTLSLDVDVKTRYLNGYELYELHEKLSVISSRAVNDLTVRGNISWESSGRSSLTTNQAPIGPLDSIIRNSLVQTSDTSELQEVNGEIRIESSTEGIPGVFARRVEYRSDYSKRNNSTWELIRKSINGIDLGEIVNQSVLDDPQTGSEIQIASEKSFGEDLTTSRLSVAGEIGIGVLNEWRVDDLNSSIVGIKSLSRPIEQEDAGSDSSSGRPHRQDDHRARTMIFSEDVNVRKLIIRTKSVPQLNGVPITEIVVSSSDAPNKLLPDNTYLEHLTVYDNAFINSIDSIDFDEFVNDRVTLGMDHEVDGNIRFNGRIQVSDYASVGAINGIVPSDLVINNSHQDQIITGDKIFQGDIATYGKTHAPRIAGINLKEEYDNAVLNYENADIIGDIIFEANVETSGQYTNSAFTGWQLSSKSFVNEMPLKSLIKNRDTEEDNFLRALMRNESRLEDRVARAANATSHLPKIFYYFESEKNFRINVAKVDRVEALRVDELTILNMYANQLGRYCGLADECPCRKQYVAEINSNECQIRQVDDSRRIIYNFHSTNGGFGINVATRSVSSSKRCTTVESSSSEFTTISWMKNLVGASPGETLGANITREELEIHGYLSDVQVFMQNDLVFIVLAIYYDPINESHQTNSLIYALDLATDVITLVQRIPTSHAIRVQVFKIPNRGAHVLFSSLAASEIGKPAESLLYRIEPDTIEFELLRSFSTGGNRHAKSVTQSKDEFLLLDDVATNSINVYIYDKKSENFQHYQSLYQDTAAPITAIEAFYAGEFRHSQAYVIVTTEHDQFFVYEYMFIGSFQLIARKRVNGILAMIPFDVSSRRYILVGTDTNSTVLRIIQQGGRH